MSSFCGLIKALVTRTEFLTLFLFPGLTLLPKYSSAKARIEGPFTGILDQTAIANKGVAIVDTLSNDRDRDGNSETDSKTLVSVKLRAAVDEREECSIVDS